MSPTRHRTDRDPRRFDSDPFLVERHRHAETLRRLEEVARERDELRRKLEAASREAERVSKPRGMTAVATEAFLELALSEGRIALDEVDVWRRAFERNASEVVRLFAQRPRDPELAARNALGSPAVQRELAWFAHTNGIAPERLL